MIMQSTFILLCLYCYKAHGEIYASEHRVPDAPGSVRVSTTSTSATLWWEPPHDKRILVRGYTVAYGIGAPSKRIVIEGAVTNSFTINRLRPNTTYVFAVGAYNEAEGEDGERVLLSASTLAGKSDAGEPLWPPIAVRAIASSNGVLEVSWEDPNPDRLSSEFQQSSLRHYVVQYGIYQSQHLQKLRSNSQSVKLTGLLSGKEYEIAVKVIGEDGRESPWSIRDIVLTPTDPSAEVSRYDWICDFEKDFCGMKNGDGLQWKSSDGIAASGSNFVSIDPTQSQYKFASLLSPSFHMQSSAALCLRFKYFLKQAEQGQLYVELRNELQSTRRELLRVSVNSLPSDEWKEITLPIYPQKHPFKLMFEVSWETEGPWIGLDKIELSSGACPSHEASVKIGNIEASVEGCGL